MSPILMDTQYDSNSPSSMSAEDHSNNAGSEREGEVQQEGPGGVRRQKKNRDAARKSRKKQTERADELHEELQSLERSNSALKKEIASLKKDFNLYTTALERHVPVCALRASASSSTTCLSVSPSADCRTGPSPLQASRFTQAAGPSLSTSSTSSLGLQTLNTVESSHLSSSTPAPTAPSLVSSAQRFTPSSSIPGSYPMPFPTVPPPHSLFREAPPSLTASGMTKRIRLISSKEPPSSLATPAQPKSGQGAHLDSSLDSGNACFSPRPPCALDAFPNVGPLYSTLASGNTGQAAQAWLMNMSQLHPGSFKGNPAAPPSTLQGSAPQPLSVSPQANPEPSPDSANAAHNSTPLLSLLTVPCPLNVSQMTSSSFEGPLSLPQLQLQNSGDCSLDLALSELLDFDDWFI
ncbi:basic leucine zipper transcriptional factor ATF-like 2 [Labrus mixtus]|uniref:basic leucine zipper transcriptional factor ATF-like 2 n=1 Tax=Labrus mixtus TaxID=508554 RepID=UPI0029C06721|nr:basic leucine zipper transcriptional factor ATF-like 2 [Labrus mixtus]